MKRPGLNVFILLTLVSLFYGINYSALKVAVPNYVGAFGFIVYRVIISAVIFGLISLPKGEKIDWKKDGMRFALCALTGVAINQLLFYKGLSITTAVNGSIIMTLTPVMVLVWASLINKETITRWKVAGLLLGLVGALIIFYRPESLPVQGHWVGDLLVFINGASYACYLVIVKPLMKKYQPMTVITWIFIIAIFFVVPVGFKEASQINPSDFPLKVWLSVGFGIIAVTVLAYFINAWALVRVDSSVVGAFIYLQPVFATLTAILFFNEIFLLKHLLAAAFVFAGVWLVTKQSS